MYSALIRLPIVVLVSALGAASIGCHPLSRPPRADVITLGMRIEGRHVVTQDSNNVPHARVAYSNTRLSWRTVGEAAWVCAHDLPGPDANALVPVANQYDVQVDGIDYPLFEPPLNPRCVAVARGLAAGLHTIRLTKRTEASVGETLFARPVGPRRRPPLGRTRQLLAIGDSITCGYGVWSANAQRHFDPRDEDGTRSFVALAARSLSASVETVAYSGRGVWRNRDGTSEGTLPALWERAVPGVADAPSWPSRADAVVVHLGTNDVSAGPLDALAFERAYRQLLARTDLDAPGALTVLAAGPMVSNKPSAVSGPGLHNAMVAMLDSLAAERRQQGLRTVTLAFSPQDEPPYDAMGLGGDYHPSLAVQADMGHKLTQLLARELHW